MNLPNRLTLSRIVMIPIFVMLVEFAFFDEVTPAARTVMCLAATLVYIAAAITDLVDGALARRWNLITDFGKLFDPLADKLLVAAALVLFVYHHLFHTWVVVVILSREFIVTGLRGLGGSAERMIAADRWGKAKTISQSVAIIWGLVHLTLDSAAEAIPAWGLQWTGPDGLRLWSGALLDVLIALCLFATVASGLTYLVRNRDLLKSS